jgi:hypothetical protein
MVLDQCSPALTRHVEPPNARVRAAEAAREPPTRLPLTETMRICPWSWISANIYTPSVFILLALAQGF